MGKRGGSSGFNSRQGAEKQSPVFKPSVTDETARRISEAHNVKVTGQTITLKNDQLKTSGMIRGIRRFTDMPPAEQSEVNARIRAAGGGFGGGVKAADIFEHDGQLYVLNNMYTQKAQAIMGENPGKNEKLRRLEQAGFIIVNYDRR